MPADGPEWRLYVAAVVGRLNEVRELLESGVSPNSDHARGGLDTLVRAGNLAGVQMYLQHGVLPDNCVSALSTAIRYQPALVDILVAHGTPLRTEHLDAAASAKNTTLLTRLLDQGVQPGLRSIDCAAQSGSVDIVSALLAKGAPAASGISIAAYRGPQEMLEALLARVTADEVPRDAMARAVRNRRPTRIRLLLDKGGPVDGEALCAAAEQNRLDLVKKFIERGVDVNEQSVLKLGETALWHAAKLGHTEIVKKLLQHGATASAPAEQLYRTASYENGTYRKGGFCALPTGSKVGALHAAAFHLHLGAVKLLLPHTPVDELDHEYGTALHAACARQPPAQAASQAAQRRIVRLLLFHNADHSLKNKQGLTAAQLAASKGLADIASFINCVANHEREALAAAAENRSGAADLDGTGPGEHPAKRGRREEA